MVTNCGGFDYFGLTEGGFAHDTLELLLIVIPAAAVFLLWRLFVTNKTEPVQRLGLEDAVGANRNSILAVSRPLLFLYVMTSVTTFTVGVLVYQAYLMLSSLFLTR